jgi:hypothetical protein
MVADEIFLKSVLTKRGLNQASFTIFFEVFKIFFD